MDKLARIRELYQKKANLKASSNAKGKEVFEHIEKYVPTNTLKIKNIPKQLYPYQVEGVDFIKHHDGNCLLGDDMGLGKTAQIIAYLQHNKDIRPALVICKATLKLKWAIETFSFSERHIVNTAYVLSGRKKKTIQEIHLKGDGTIAYTVCKKMPTTGIFIINYDILDGWVKEISELKPKIIPIDEAHNFKSYDTSRWKAFQKIVKNTGCRRFIPTSGTLIENRPMDLFNALNLVSPSMFPNRFLFGKRYCGAKQTAFGWEFKGKSNIKELHHKLSSIMIRRKKSEVLKDLPKMTRVIIPVDIDMKEYRAIEKMESGPQKRELLLQASAKGKLEFALDWIEDFLASGRKLVVFAQHKAIVHAVYEEFKDWCIKIDGTVDPTKKQEAEFIFQNDKRIRLISGNIKSAGEGLTLTAAYATLTIELLDHTPSQHLQAEDRVLRIGQESDKAFAYYLLAVGTIDEENILELERRSQTAAQVIDGVDQADFTPN